MTNAICMVFSVAREKNSVGKVIYGSTYPVDESFIKKRKAENIVQLAVSYANELRRDSLAVIVPEGKYMHFEGSKAYVEWLEFKLRSVPGDDYIGYNVGAMLSKQAPMGFKIFTGSKGGVVWLANIFS